jgi:hypothetical protein
MRAKQVWCCATQDFDRPPRPLRGSRARINMGGACGGRGGALAASCAAWRSVVPVFGRAAPILLFYIAYFGALPCYNITMCYNYLHGGRNASHPPGGCPGSGHLGVAMSASPSASRFLSVPASFSGRVVLRAHRSGSVWAWRAVRRGDRPSPACLFLPAPSRGLALRLGRLRALTSVGPLLCGSVSVARSGGLARWPPPRRPGLVRSCLPADTSAAAGRAALARADRALALQGA